MGSDATSTHPGVDLASARLGVLGGSGLYSMDGLEDQREITVETPFGTPSDSLRLGRIGDLEVRLARGPADVRLAQQLRYDVFYGEMAAKPSQICRMRRRDEDRYDAVCDHLLVLDRSLEAAPVIGTYRVLRQEVAARSFGFYTQGEYDIAPLIAAPLKRH